MAFCFADYFHRPPNQDQYGICIIHEPQDATVDIILVHGLTGNRETTWTYVVRRGQTTFWPEFLTEDVPNARIATFGYDADIASPRPFEMVSTNTVHRHAVNLCNDLGRVRTGEKMKRPIIFIAHSLGGLVCKDAILYSKDSPQDHLKNISECTRAMAFLGTPHRGSNKANLGHLLARLAKLMKQTNTNIVGVLKPDSEVLNTMQEKFYHMLENRRNAGKKIDITCFYEELDDKKFGEIVPHDSATMLNYTSIGIHTDHSGLTKFQNADNEGYKKLLGEIKRWVEALENDDADDADDELVRHDPDGYY
ncbi:hypothetical protein K440DRAFT_535979 [Wilcoxina mikolae CBS 423.85]|nr:hypothetical protein K440DRAFT_535979 [Wilcoxina mikolae CBS 423.85]